MSTSEQIQSLFEKKKGRKIIDTGIQDTGLHGFQDYPDHPEKCVWVDFEDLSRIIIRVALTDEGSQVLGFMEDAQN